MTEQEEMLDLVKANLELCRESIRHAELKNWGRHVHAGRRLLAQLKTLHAELDGRPTITTKDELVRVSKLRMALCDLMWQSEHGL
jgi:hypothetical protein